MLADIGYGWGLRGKRVLQIQAETFVVQKDDALFRIMENEHFVFGGQANVGDDEISEEEEACGDACI